MVIGAFCSGTNNIDMPAVSALGVIYNLLILILYIYILYINFGIFKIK